MYIYMYTLTSMPDVMSTRRVAVLVQSDIWRDGGSLSATVLHGDRHRSFWLDTDRLDDSHDGHRNLFVSDGERPESREVMIAMASTEELRWLSYLEQVDDAAAADGSRRQFRRMIDVLRSRHGAARS